MSRTLQQGFSAVEVLVTVMVGIMFIGAIAQMYGVVMSDAAAVRNRATASSVAYAQLRSLTAAASAPCSAWTGSYAGPTSLPSPVTVSTAEDCPYTATYANNAVSRLTVTVTYGSGTSQESVKHVLYTY